MSLTKSDIEKVTELLEAQRKGINSDIGDVIDNQIEYIDKRFDEVDKRFDEVDAKFEQVYRRFDKLDERVDRISKSQENEGSRIKKLETQVSQ